MDRLVVEVSSLSLSFCFFLWLSTYPPSYLSMYPSISLSLCLSVCLSTNLSIYLSIFLSFLSLSLSVSISLSVCLSVCLSICLSASLNTKLFWETSSVLELDKIQNKAILREASSIFWTWQHQKRSNSARLLNFVTWQHQKRSNFVRLPDFLKLTTSKTKQFCETSCKNKSWVQSWRPRTNAFCDFSTPPV